MCMGGCVVRSVNSSSWKECSCRFCNGRKPPIVPRRRKFLSTIRIHWPTGATSSRTSPAADSAIRNRADWNSDYSSCIWSSPQFSEWILMHADSNSRSCSHQSMTDPNLPGQTCAQIELICWSYLATVHWVNANQLMRTNQSTNLHKLCPGLHS